MSDAERAQTQSQSQSQSSAPSSRRLAVRHVTRFDYDAPVAHGVQQLRLTPKTGPGQTVVNWSVTVEGGTKELSYDDSHQNRVDLLSTTPGATRLEVVCEGEIDIQDRNGIFGQQMGFMPLWLFQRETPRTKAGPLTRKLLQKTEEATTSLARMHALSRATRKAVNYVIGASEPDWTAEQALEAGCGVCQDHAHIFIAAARAINIPARYVSGYLMLDDRIDQDATHAWAEVWIDGLGWTGFDVSNSVAPDARYVRVATGLDYSDAAPLSGTRFGNGDAHMIVEIQVQQQ